MKCFLSFVIGILYFLSISSVAAENIEIVNNPDTPSLIGYSKGSIVIQFNESAGLINPQQTRDGIATVGINSLDILSEKYKITNIKPQFPGAKPIMFEGQIIDLSRDYIIRFDTEVNIDEIVIAFRENENISKSQPIEIYHFDTAPNDPEYINQWHLNKVDDHDIDAPEGWDSETGGTDIVVAILDSGVRYFHKDLGGSNASYSNPAESRGNMWINWAEKNGQAGIDDDSNGFIDDWIGWDFLSDDNDPRDLNGHGTHLAGIVAAGTNDGYGSSGVAGGWQNGILPVEGNGVKIMALRVGDSSADMALAAQAFYYATINGAKIANCSWPSGNSGNLDDAIAYFLANGGIIFKSAGNLNSLVPDYINGLESGAVISVAATDSLDKKADFSNYGMWVDISAPGTNIVSTDHNNQAPETDFWTAKSGTSMASPMAAATAALIWSHWPQWNREQVITWLLESCVDNIRIYLDLQHSLNMGSGRINISKVQCPNNEPEEWNQVYAVNKSDLAVDILQISTGEYITLINGSDINESIASDFNIYIQKTNIYGCMEWSKSVEYSSTNELNAQRLIQTSDGGYLIVGDLQVQPDDKDVMVIKADSNGNKIWEKYFGGPYEQSGSDVLETSEGDYIIIGSGENALGNNDVLLMKIDGDTGDSLAAVLYGQNGITAGESGQQILADHFGGYIAMGSVDNGSAYFLWLDNNLDSTKTIVYSKLSMDIFLGDIELTSDNGYICAGNISLEPSGSNEKNIFILKLDSEGNECWSRSFGEPSYNESGWGIKGLPDGSLIVAGETDAAGQSARDIVLYKTNACGNLHWEQTFDESGDEYPRGLIQTIDNGFVICGSSRETYETNGHSNIIKIPAQPSYLCGDVNGDGSVNILDVVYIINYKYKGGSAPDPVNRGDVNCDGNVDILDTVYLTDFKYKGGAAPCPCN